MTNVVLFLSCCRTRELEGVQGSRGPRRLRCGHCSISFRTLRGETFRAVIHNLLKLWPCAGAGPFGGGTKSCMTLSQNGSRSVLSLGRSIIVYKSTRTYGCTCYQNGVKPRTVFTRMINAFGHHSDIISDIVFGHLAREFRAPRSRMMSE